MRDNDVVWQSLLFIPKGFRGQDSPLANHQTDPVCTLFCTLGHSHAGTETDLLQCSHPSQHHTEI